MVYLIKDDVMHVKEMIYLNREAQKGLWEYIHAHDSMIDEVRGNTYFNEPIAFDMDDSDIVETIQPYIMGRIVDVAQFLEQYPCAPGANLRIALDVTDTFMEVNNRTFVVDFCDGRTSVVETDRDDGFAHVALSIGTLTCLLLGYKTAAQLFERERIQGDAAVVDALDEALLHEYPYISDYI